MRELLDLRYQKKIEMIELIFYSKNHSIAQTELLDALEVTYPTLVATVDKVNLDAKEFGYNDFTIVHSPQQQLFSLEIKEDLGIQFMFSAYLKKSLKFQLLQLLLTESFPTMKILANKMNVSYFSIRQTVKQLNEKLDSRHMSISTDKEVAIVGNELAIRLYYSVLYLFVYGGGEWPFSFIHYFEISKLLADCPKEIYVSGTIDKTLLVHYYTAIHLLRDKKGQFLSDINAPLYSPPLIEEEDTYRSFVLKMKKYLVNANDAYVNYTSSALISCILAFGNYSTIETPPPFFYLDKRLQDLDFLASIYLFVEQLEQNFLIPFSTIEKNKILYALMSTHYRTLLFEDMNLDLDSSLPVYRALTRHPSKLFKIDYLKQLIRKIMDSNASAYTKLDQTYLEKEYVLILDKYINLSKHTKEIKVAVLSIVSNELLTQEFKANFSAYYNIEVVEEYDRKIDLFISDFLLSKEVIKSLKIKHPIVYVHTKLAEGYYEKLNKQLAEIATIKLKK
ncbi:Mga helix-turn-helix domain-containing protein [Enterococcus malodoratus]|nr:Mga helix-turn-helix domain-containing protein [Enterococcus malodoratus]